MKRNKYSTEDLLVEDQRPTMGQKLVSLLETLSLGNFDDPVAAESYQRELDEEEYTRKFFDQMKRTREYDERIAREGAPPLRKFGVPGIFDSWDSYLMNKPDRDNQGNPLRKK